MKEIHKLKPLPYDYDALEPFIEKETLLVHHGKHHQGYVNNLNKGLLNFPKYHDWSLVKLLTEIEKLPLELKIQVEKHGGGTFNHEVYFAGMSKKKTVMNKEFEKIFMEKFQTLDNFKDLFKKAALNVFGSGWAWLVKDKNNELSIIETSNQKSPLSIGLIPLLTIDVWEHAYYLKYKNLRGQYIDNWFEVINWEKVSELFLNNNFI